MAVGAKAEFSDLAEDFGRAWNRFWFTPGDALPAARLRIAVGILAALHFCDLATGLSTWYASDGVMPPAAVNRLLDLTASGTEFRYSYLNFIPDSSLLVAMHVLAIAVSLAFAAGFLTRISGVLTLVALLTYIHRVPEVAGHAEPVLCFLVGLSSTLGS